MSYQNVLDGLQAALETLSGPVAVLQYEPPAFDDLPLIYLLFDRSTDATVGQVRGTRYYVTIRLVVRWQDNEEAEKEIIPYIDSIPAAVHADRSLGGLLASGLAHISGAEGGFVDVGAVRYRVVDFVADVLDKTVT